MKPLMIVTAMVIVHANLFGNLYHFYPSIIQWGLHEFPNLTCSLTVHEFFAVLLSYFFKAILVFKALARLSPADYLSMDHIKVWKVTFASIMGFWMMEYIIVLTNYKTLCTVQNIENLQNFHNMSVDKDYMEKKPATFYMHTAAILGLRMLIYVLIILKKRYVVNKIHPYVCSIFPGSIIIERPETKSLAVCRTHDDLDNVEINNFLENDETLAKEILETTTEEIACIDAKQPNTNSIKESPMNRGVLKSLTGVPIIYNNSGPNTVEYSANLNSVRITINTHNSSNNEDNNNDTANVSEPPVANLKHLLLNTDIAIWISTMGLVLAIFTVYINSENKGVIIVHLIVARIFFLALPPYWILRSEDKTLFAERGLKRFFNLHRNT